MRMPALKQSRAGKLIGPRSAKLAVRVGSALAWFDKFTGGSNLKDLADPRAPIGYADP